MGVTTTKTNKPLNPRGNDQSPLAFNRAKLYSGKALDFDGVNDYVDAGTLDITDYTQMSVSFYMNVDTTTQDFRLISIRYSGADDIRIFHSVSIGGGVLNFSLDDGDVDNIGVNFETNQWYHVVMTHDGTTLKAYFNGVEQASTASTFDYANADGLFYIGRYTGGDVTYYDGEASNVKAFNTALTAAQVADLYNNPEKVVPTGVDNTALKLWLPMMEGAGTTAINGAPDALGSEEVTNGDFATDSDWTKGTGWTISGGTANANSALTGTPLSQYIDTGKKYRITYDVVSLSQGAFQVDLSYSGTALGQLATTTGTFTDVITSLNPALSIRAVGTTTGSIDNVSVKELTDFGTISGATWTHGIGAPVAQTSVIDWNKVSDGTNEVLIPQGLTAGRDLLGNLFENVRKQGALNLDGNSWAEVHDNASLDITDAITLEAWVYNDGSSFDGFLGRWFTTGNNRSVMIYESSSNEARMIVAKDGANGFNANGTMISGWNHIVGTCDDTEIKIYINGVKGTDGTAPSGSIHVSSYPYEIGRYNSSVSSSHTNQIAQPRIYNRALTAEEVQRNYNAGKNIYK